MSHSKLLSASPQHKDRTDLFLESYIRHWVSINSITVRFADEIAKVFHRNIEVTIIEPTSACCDVSVITAPNDSVFRSSIPQLETFMIQKYCHVPHAQLNNDDQYNISNSVFAGDSYNIVGMDISF